MSKKWEAKMAYFDNVKKNFGFGLMRLPTKALLIDHDELCKMVDMFMEAGFNYFDTAHGYMEMRSESAARKALVERYPRESFVLTNKLSNGFFKTEKNIRPLLDRQLKKCGVEYFDFYLMHALNAESYEKYKKCNAFEVCKQLKAEGKIRHIGISFHDKSDVLRKILSEQPDIEVVQIQFNYLDYDDPTVEGKENLEVCREFNKPVIVMEPVKGGILAKLPEEAQEVFDEMDGGSAASYAIRYCAGFDGIFMTISGMGNTEMMADNISYMKDFKPLDETEMAAVEKVRDIIDSKNLIDCTGCKYCLEVCPKDVPIPELFACYNSKKQFKSWNTDMYYNIVANVGSSNCIGCGKCEAACPQHLNIRDLFKKVKREFGK